MKILRKGNPKPAWPKQGKCGTCGCKVEVEQKEVQDARDRPGEEPVWMADCPEKECGGKIYFR